MRRVVLFYLLCIFFSCSKDEETRPTVPPDIFHFSYGFPHYDGRSRVNFVAVDGGFMMAVNQVEVPSNFPNYKIAFAHLNETGSVTWAKRIFTPASESLEISDLQVAGDSYLLLGSAGPGLPVVAQVDRKGEITGARKYTSSQGVAFDKCVVDDAGNWICSGTLYNESNYTAMMVKMTPAGKVIWGKEIFEKTSRSLNAVHGQSIYMANQNFRTGATLYKFTAQGELLTQLTLERPNETTTLEKIVVTEHGVYVVLLDYYLSKTYIVQADTNLNIKQIQSIGGFYFADLLERDSKLTLTGFTEGEMRIVELDSDLEIVREKVIASLVGSNITVDAQADVSASHITIALGHIAVNPAFKGAEINVIRVKTDDLEPRCTIEDTFPPTVLYAVTFEESPGANVVENLTLQSVELELSSETIALESYKVCQ